MEGVGVSGGTGEGAGRGADGVGAGIGFDGPGAGIFGCLGSLIIDFFYRLDSELETGVGTGRGI